MMGRASDLSGNVAFLAFAIFLFWVVPVERLSAEPTETLDVSTNASTEGRVRIVWANQKLESAAKNEVSTEYKTVSIPRTYFVGTKDDGFAIPNEARFRWKFKSGFVEVAGVQSGVRLSVFNSIKSCPPSSKPEDLFEGASGEFASTEDGLSILLKLGHWRMVCRKTNASHKKIKKFSKAINAWADRIRRDTGDLFQHSESDPK